MNHQKRCIIHKWVIRRWEHILAYATIVAAIVLLSLFFYYVSPHNDSGNNIVSALSILVTILIGWQIYSVINLKETQNSLDKSTNEANIIKRDFNNFKRYVDAETHANNAASLYILKRYIESILNTLKALQLYAEIEGYTDKKDDIKRGIHLCVTNWATCLTEGRGKSQYSATSDFIDADDKKLYKIILKMLQDERPILSITKINDDIKSLYDLMTKINPNNNNNNNTLNNNDIKIIIDIHQRNSAVLDEQTGNIQSE